jgi:hypothetical protein
MILFLKLVGMFAILLLLMAAPAALSFLLCLILWIIWVRRRQLPNAHWFDLAQTCTLAAATIISIIKLATFITVLVWSGYYPWKLKGLSGVSNLNPVITIFWRLNPFDTGLIESLVESRYSRVRNGTVECDPFNRNRHFYYRGGMPYSLGPDATDDALSITYDPTNGFFSRGDIAVGKSWKREQH